MPDLESYLARWQSAGILDRESDAGLIARMRALEVEEKKPAGLRWQSLVALILGAILLACGVVLFVSAHWDHLSPLVRFLLVLAMVSFFHLGGALSRESSRIFSTTFHAVGTIATGAAIALVGQIFNIHEHWPGAVLLWAIAALAGFVLLHDEAQQTLTVLLFPAWLASEIAYAADGYIGGNIYLGRFLIVWAALLLTIYLGSRRRTVAGICFAAAAIAAIVGISLIAQGWVSQSENSIFLPLGARIWDWGVIAAVPLFFTLFRRRESLIPVSAGIFLAIVLPWCAQTTSQNYANGVRVLHSPNVGAHALVAAFSIVLSWWGVRMVSRALVNFGIVGFAISVIWFYFSDVFDKVGRSLGLMGLGILFLAGGWFLEKTRRHLIAQMLEPEVSPQEAL